MRERLTALICAAFMFVLVGGVAACADADAPQAESAGEATTGDGMGMDMAVEDAPEVPPVRGFAAGEEILFLHTEASDTTIARTLTDMMGGSPVLHVPELARADEALLADVYVFTNGPRPDRRGPLGFQADVFDCVPGEECYRPLRRVNLVTWMKADSARLLRSAADVRSAAESGEIELERSDVVVNMPIIRWPGGER